MKTAKLGAMFLISIMALAGVGAGYAAWTDTIYIDGTVNTGDVDLNVVGYSGTWVYKVPDQPVGYPDEIAIRHISYTNPAFEPIYPMGWIPVAKAWATAGQGDDEVVITFDNLFPCINFMADVEMEYQGSIPVKIEVVDQGLDGDLIDIPYVGEDIDWLQWMYCSGYMTVSFFIKDDSGQYTIPVQEGYQLHQGDDIKLVVTIHIPQEIEVWDGQQSIMIPTDFLMDVDGTGYITFGVIQWNEYGIVK